ncbi:MAG: DnaJ domain-containing protein [Alphaproteobacteria bacterium]|nr:DnaJ domain-containing protein [Alphaproteobacteria bacterium]
MRKQKATGFPRWTGYNTERDPIEVRSCDHDGCGNKGDFPAPKSPDSKDKWQFCERHITEFNRNWNYFEGLSREEAFRRAQEEMRTAKGYATSGAYQMGEASYGKDRRRSDALIILDLDDDATAAEIKTAYRRMAKLYHPDTNLGDSEAAIKFQQVITAYEVLTAKS